MSGGAKAEFKILPGTDAVGARASDQGQEFRRRYRIKGKLFTTIAPDMGLCAFSTPDFAR